MSQFFETINYRDGHFALIDYHEERMNRTRLEVFGYHQKIDLRRVLESNDGGNGWQRCRVVYAKSVDNVEFIPYEMAIHRSVRLHEVKGFAYMYKAVNREFINNSVRESGCDDVIMLQDGWLTDASYANICLYQDGQWYTPDNCLLPGVKRQFLLDRGKIKTRLIHIHDLPNYTAIAFINAMRDFEMVYEYEFADEQLDLRDWRG